MTELTLEERISILEGYFQMEKENATWKGRGNAITDSWEIVRDSIKQLREWNNDLQSGMYINCVYCGHRYGPKNKIPTSMADVLKEHIEHCSKHPMSKLKKVAEELKKEVRELKKFKRSFEQHNEEYF